MYVLSHEINFIELSSAIKFLQRSQNVHDIRMATTFHFFLSPFSSTAPTRSTLTPPTRPPLTHPLLLPRSVALPRFDKNSLHSSLLRLRRSLKPLRVSMFSDNLVVNDYCALALSGAVAAFILWFWGQIAKRGTFDQKLIRKCVHISIGLAFMLLWPLFSYRSEAAYLAALIPGVNIIRMLLIGFGIFTDEATVKSISRFGDYRELLKGPLYYATTITLASVVYWRTSPIAIAAICNLCAGDGLADIIGRRFGGHKLPYNINKSYAGTIAMAAAGFLASIGYMHYFSLFGLVDESWEMLLGFFIVSIVSSVVESLPISSDLDDNLTVPLTSLLVGTLVF